MVFLLERNIKKNSINKINFTDEEDDICCCGAGGTWLYTVAFDDVVEFVNEVKYKELNTLDKFIKPSSTCLNWLSIKLSSMTGDFFIDFSIRSELFWIELFVFASELLLLK